MQDSSTSQCLPLRKKRYRSATIALLFALAGCSWPALAQVMNTTSESSEYSPSQSSATSIPSSVGSLNQNPFTGSVAEGKVSPEVLPLSFKDAIDRGLRNNLGLLLQSDSVIAARGRRWKELSDLLPNLSAGVSENVAQQNLAALGLRFPSNSPFGKIPQIVGPYGYFDARVYWSQSLFNLKSLDRERGAAANLQAARYSYKDARDLVVLGLEESLQRAYASRSDYQAALQQVRSAEHFRNAATAEHFPSLGFAANYGDLGVTPGNSHGTFQVTGSLTIPIFPGGKIHADVLQAEATLRQNRAQLGDLRGRIEYEIRTALLDLAAANEQVQVAQSSVDLANQTLLQARDRFAAGVTDNLEVVQAQESVAAANENYISSLYAHNLAKIELARAIGYAEEGVKRYFQSK